MITLWLPHSFSKSLSCTHEIYVLEDGFVLDSNMAPSLQSCNHALNLLRQTEAIGTWGSMKPSLTHCEEMSKATGAHAA